MISVVIPSRNGAGLLAENLPAVCREVGDSGEVVVVDDGSTDRTANLITSRFPRVRLVRREGQNGFCYAVNEGMEVASGDYLLLLNNDVVPSSGSFTGICEELQKAGERFYSAVPAILRPDGNDESRCSVVFRRGLARAVMGASLGLPYPSGACALFRRSAWEALGGLSTVFAPIYWEDADLGARAHRMGMRILHVPQLKVYHHHAATMGSSLESESLRERNRFLFMDRNYGSVRYSLSRRLWLPLHLLKAYLTGNRPFIRGYRDYRAVSGTLSPYGTAGLWL